MTTTDGREQRGLIIAATKKLVKKGGAWLVPSDTGSGQYTVVPDAHEPHCSCPDHETTGKRCKHIYAVQITIKREQNPDGSVTETQTLTLTQKRTTYPQKWNAYEQAQRSEKANFQVMLRDLCQHIPDPPACPKGGRPSVPMRDQLFAAIFKVYSTMSCRRFNTDLQEAMESGHISYAPSKSSIFRAFESPATFDVLKSLVVKSASPLKSIETNFACDSTGFSGCRFDRWFDEKWGKPVKREQRVWVKCHAMVGVKTNVVTAVEIFGQYAHDGVQLPELLRTTAQQFTIGDVTGDLAYSSHDNLLAVKMVGGEPMIPFKKTTSGASGGLWAKMFHYFNLHREEFLSCYHLRSNVESTFSAIKRKFGDAVRSKTDVAMKNEVLAKLVCHNICCVNQEAHELGIDPTFSAQPQLA